MARAHDLIAGCTAEAVIADRAYDADHLHDAILEAGAEPVIPPRRHRRRPHAYDKVLDKERNLIERFCAKLKQFRRVATRDDTLLTTYLGFVKLAATVILLR